MIFLLSRGLFSVEQNMTIIRLVLLVGYGEFLQYLNDYILGNW